MSNQTLLSTKQVAELLHVAETTIKRWADEQTLVCVRTPGGHRKFAATEVVAFAEQHHYPLTGLTPPPMTQDGGDRLQRGVQTQDFQLVSEIFLEHALQGDRQGLYDLLVYVYTHQIPFARIADTIIRPAMETIGDRWSKGLLEVDQEHRASQATLEALHRFGAELHRKPSHGRSVVSSCMEGELHSIGLQCVAYGLESEGWAVHMLGANTPHESLLSYVRRFRPQVVALSSTIRQNEKWRDAVASLTWTVHSWNGIVIFGGNAAQGASANDLGCDFVTQSLEEALSYVRDRFHLKPGPKKSKTTGQKKELQ